MKTRNFGAMPFLWVALWGVTAACATKKADALSGASYAAPGGSAQAASADGTTGSASDRLVVFAGTASGSTAKLAVAISETLGAESINLASAASASAESLRSRRLIGFGSGIFNGRNDGTLIAFAEGLPPCPGVKAFIFSTCGAPAGVVTESESLKAMRKNHLALRTVLEAKGFDVIGEFSCPGFNDNSFLKLFGGINKGRPDSGDINRARLFARRLLPD